jgi:molybdate transport system regulatory protein
MKSQADFRFRMRLSVGERVAVGPGRIALLEALAETGSITAAAKRLGMSYRRAWLLVDELNSALKEPAVATSQGGSRGGGSHLTASGRHLLALYRGIEQQALARCEGDIAAMKNLLREQD